MYWIRNVNSFGKIRSSFRVLACSTKKGILRYNALHLVGASMEISLENKLVYILFQQMISLLIGKQSGFINVWFFCDSGLAMQLNIRYAAFSLQVFVSGLPGGPAGCLA